ncbi:MAG: AmmeMemoRadiSam system protein B [Pseudoramibacter sp.]
MISTSRRGAKPFGDFGPFGAPDVTFDIHYDTALRDAIVDLAEGEKFPAGTMGERTPSLTPDHGTLVPLYFIRRRYPNFKLVRLGLSGLSLEDHWHLGALIAKAVRQTGRRCVYVASGDLSHCQKADGPYGFHPQGPEYDARLIDVMSRGRFRGAAALRSRLFRRRRGMRPPFLHDHGRRPV